MPANTNAVTLSVALLSLLFLLSNAVDVDPTSITATQVKDEITAVDSESTAVISTTSEEVKTEDRVVFHPAVESISAVNPDLIAHSFRIPFHRRSGRSRCRHGHADGFLRLTSGHAHRHFHRGEGFGFDPERMQEKNKMEEKESIGTEESKKEFDEEEFQHKRKKMRENKDDKKMEDFEHKRKKMMKRMRFNNGEAEEFEHEKDDSDEKEDGKKFGHKRMRRFRKKRGEGGLMDRVHHFFDGFF